MAKLCKPHQRQTAAAASAPGRKATELDRFANAVLKRAIDIRRKIHAQPRLSGREQDTAALIYRNLAELGLKPRFYMRKTGVAAMVGNGGGPVAVLRADLDALPIDERTGVPFRSRTPGVMHACGHDMHAAMLWGAAAALSRLRHRLRGSVVFLFQPAEEQEPGGAIYMIREGAFPAHADAVFALHVCTDHPTGVIGIKTGAECCGVLGFEAEVIGKGGHGAMPESAIDPIVCASAMICALQTLVSRETPARDAAVVTVGSIHAGHASNVIAEQARFAGTIRTFSLELQQFLQRRMQEMFRAIAQAYRAQCRVKFLDSYPPGYNDPALAARIGAALRLNLGAAAVVNRDAPAMFAEDFAFYQQKAPGVLAHLGVRPRGCASMPGIHSPRFLPDENALRTGILAHCVAALEIAGGARPAID